MSIRTCQDAYDALVDGIERRWKPRAQGIVSNVPCALCSFSCKCVSVGQSKCLACPLYLFDGKGCSRGSIYHKYINARDVHKQYWAKQMLARLEKVKKHFFGDWERKQDGQETDA